MKDTIHRKRKKRVHGKVRTIRLAMKDCVGCPMPIPPYRYAKYMHAAARRRHALHQSPKG
jgi:hypothetical protein